MDTLTQPPDTGPLSPPDTTPYFLRVARVRAAVDAEAALRGLPPDPLAA